PKPEVNFEGAQGEVFAMLQKFAETLKAKNYEGLIPMILFKNAQQQETFRKLLPLKAKEEKLDEACRARFGRTFNEIAEELINQYGGDGSSALPTGERMMERLRSMDPADLEIKVVGDGTEAEVTFKSNRTAEPLELVKRDNAWLLKIDYEIEG